MLLLERLLAVEAVVVGGYGSWRYFRSFAGWTVGVGAVSDVGIIAEEGASGVGYWMSGQRLVVYYSRERCQCYRSFYSLLLLYLYAQIFILIYNKSLSFCVGAVGAAIV